jgi:hypothetical protein
MATSARPSSTARRPAAHRDIPNVHFERGDIYALPYLNGSFELEAWPENPDAYEAYLAPCAIGWLDGGYGALVA